MSVAPLVASAIRELHYESPAVFWALEGPDDEDGERGVPTKTTQGHTRSHKVTGSLVVVRTSQL
ncbi:hypothetical protein E2C01_073613 [Portunus trituberculatus]|uniref:Uncharacterized protein n=1 Tax=Portunus trituberculatus TaxID=210409 RepID=A0A5B7I3H4_PORTR|nr:hypothetical protein [Portunus trituberculatus]